jgi:hypothetical protein
LQPLPVVLPPVYEHCSRTVDNQGYVHLDNNRYTVPERLVEKPVDVYKYLNEVRINYQHQEVARHVRVIDQINKKQECEGHHTQKNHQISQNKANQSEQALLGQDAILDAYIAELKKHIRGSGVKSLTQLLYLKRTYPHDAFIAAITRAHTYSLYDLTWLEELILKYVAGDFFNLTFDKE